MVHQFFCTPPLVHGQRIGRGVNPQLSDFRQTQIIFLENHDIPMLCFKRLKPLYPKNSIPMSHAQIAHRFLLGTRPLLTHPRLPDTSMAINTAALKGNISAGRVRICSWERKMASWSVIVLDIYIYYMAVDLNSFICKRPFFANKQFTFGNLSQTPGLSFAGVSC